MTRKRDKPPPRTKRMTGEERRCRRRGMAAFAAEGASMVQLCKRYGVTSTTIHNACAEHGVVPPTTGCGKRQHQHERSVKKAFAIVRMLDEEPGLTTEAVGACFAVTGQYVRAIKLLAKEAGLLEWADGRDDEA